MPKEDNKAQNRPSLGQEVLAISGFFAAVFLLLCLVSYSPSGPAASNWCGAVGHHLARILLGQLGVSSIWLFFLLLFFSVQFFFCRTNCQRIPFVFLGCVGLLIASSGLVAAMNGSGVFFHVFGRTYPAGGRIGDILSGFLVLYFGIAGSMLLMFSAFLFSLMISLHFSPYFTGQLLVMVAGRVNAMRRPKTMARKKVETRPEPPPVEEAPETVFHVPEAIELTTYENGDEVVDDFQVAPVSSGEEYQLPSLGLLDKTESVGQEVDRDQYYALSQQLEEKLNDFGVSGKVVGISPGPIVTTYEYSPAPGIKINKIAGLADDLAMGLRAESVRIVGSIPGKAAVGIEIPNPQRDIVYIRDILGSESFRAAGSKLTIGLGKDVVGKPVLADLGKMPHLLIAGATGSGKSVGINAIICSILFKATPDEVRFLLIDPKRIELSGYEDIPHLLHPVVVEPKMANRALQWAVREMERRYEVLEGMRVKSFAEYNAVSDEKMPLIVIVVDELADLMMVSSREVEESIARLAQMARAAGMHLILATQRPSVDVLTGLIKANFPTRISFKVFSKTDSRTILDTSGAEHLLGDGDMLFLAPRKARLQRIHGAYISSAETERLVTFLKEQGTARYDETALQIAEEQDEAAAIENGDYDEKYDEAVALVCETGQASISMVQRRLRVGYNRAARMIEIMEKEGIVGPSDGSKPREVLARRTY